VKKETHTSNSSSSSSSSVIYHTTGPQPLPKRFLHLMRSRAKNKYLNLVKDINYVMNAIRRVQANLEGLKLNETH
jgi:hypothetical protein